MNLTMTAFGTRGDVQPMVALGIGLQAAGHRVKLLTHPEFETFARDAGLAFHPLPGVEIKAVVGRATERAARKGASGNQLLQAIHVLRRLRADLPVLGDAYWEACRGAELIVANPVLAGIPDSVAEKLAIPLAVAALQPFDMTAEFPFPWLHPRSLGRPLNRWSYPLMSLAAWPPLAAPVNRWRQAHLALPALPLTFLLRRLHSTVPRLYGFSAHVVPKPRGWSAHSQITGYWFLPRAEPWQPPQALADFLAAGPPPVAVGFGSMVVHNPEETTDIVVRALTRARQRGVLLTGWGGLQPSDLPDHLLALDAAPHDWLFLRMAAVVHHGGAGSTAAGFRAGVPTIVIPFMMDQPFWAQRVRDLGVGPPPIPRGQLTVERLAAAMATAVSDRGIRRRAAELGANIRPEDGVAQAVAGIQRILTTGTV
ncbi:MAG: glycosyltransferase [Candidatus Competibacteraceae bacterium]|nr:MAG: glycosyltransferase [Candidatus Competibacteraceae bacterium]